MQSSCLPTLAISQILHQRHGLKLEEDDFTIVTQKDFPAEAENITGILTIILGGIAGISLLVGGIGMMNIMLVSVSERTREMGLRKALGARQRAAANDVDFTPIVGLDAITLATLFSTAVGLFFGIYPANRAASLEPVEALHYE